MMLISATQATRVVAAARAIEADGPWPARGAADLLASHLRTLPVEERRSQAMAVAELALHSVRMGAADAPAVPA